MFGAKLLSNKISYTVTLFAFDKQLFTGSAYEGKNTNRNPATKVRKDNSCDFSLKIRGGSIRICSPGIFALLRGNPWNRKLKLQLKYVASVYKEKTLHFFFSRVIAQAPKPLSEFYLTDRFYFFFSGLNYANVANNTTLIAVQPR